MPAKEQDKPIEFERSLGIAAFVGKSLSDENRLRILLSLCNGKKTVSTVCRQQKWEFWVAELAESFGPR